MLSWSDLRSGVSEDIFAQRVSADGSLQWTQSGVALSTAAGLQNPAVSVPDGAHGAIVAWHDYRDGGGDIYAQRVQADGALGGGVTSVARIEPAWLRLALENPARAGGIRVQCSVPTNARATLELLDIQGRRVASHVFEGVGVRSLMLGSADAIAPGLYIVRLSQGGRASSARVAVLD